MAPNAIPTSPPERIPRSISRCTPDVCRLLAVFPYELSADAWLALASSPVAALVDACTRAAGHTHVPTLAPTRTLTGTPGASATAAGRAAATAACRGRTAVRNVAAGCRNGSMGPEYLMCHHPKDRSSERFEKATASKGDTLEFFLAQTINENWHRPSLPHPPDSIPSRQFVPLQRSLA